MKSYTQKVCFVLSAIALSTFHVEFLYRERCRYRNLMFLISVFLLDQTHFTLVNEKQRCMPMIYDDAKTTGIIPYQLDQKTFSLITTVKLYLISIPIQHSIFLKMNYIVSINIFCCDSDLAGGINIATYSSLALASLSFECDRFIFLIIWGYRRFALTTPIVTLIIHAKYAIPMALTRRVTHM